MDSTVACENKLDSCQCSHGCVAFKYKHILGVVATHENPVVIHLYFTATSQSIPEFGLSEQLHSIKAPMEVPTVK